jgi:hypothetical protein
VESRWITVGPNDNRSFGNHLLWYLFLMPVWCKLAVMGKRGLSFHRAKKEMMTPALSRLGRVRHKNDIIKKQRQRRSIDNTDEDCESENERFPDELGLTSMTRKSSSKSYGSVGSEHAEGEIHEMVSADCIEEDDPQDEKQTLTDFAVAIAFVMFGVIAFISGMVSILRSR